MILKKLFIIIFIFCVFLTQPAYLQQKPPDFPEFEFDIWGRAPSKVITLTKERVVQKMLFTIKERSLSIKDIAKKIDEKESLVLEKLGELQQYDVVHKQDGKWISNIPLYVEKEIREGEKLGLKYAKREADVLREEVPKLKEIYSKTTLSHYFPWDNVSLIIAGAFLADFCVVDRVPFKPENFTEEMQPPLGKEGQKKWGYKGYEILPKRFPSRKWKFYQNVTSRYSGGGARFGYYRYPDEERKKPPSRPEGLLSGSPGRILFALAEGPLSLKELEKQTRLEKEALVKMLDEMTGLNPPAVVFKDGKYWGRIPVLTESDFMLLLPELDRVAEKIFKNVVLNHLKERKERAQELGYRWPLPADTYVRDKALQILVEEGILSRVQDPPVDWNFNVWGWKGFLRMHNQITEDVKLPKPDHFVKTSLSIEEEKVIDEFNSIKERILKGEKFLDTSTPTRAFLTRMSGYYHSDLKALREVEVPGDRIRESDLKGEGFKNWAEYMIQLEIRRVRLPEKEPKDGDLGPIFTTGEGRIHVYFYYKGDWKVLFNSYYVDEYWHAGAEQTLKRKLSYLEGKHKN